jgi:ABC-type uncharacterized transport system auxiliary subunit
MRFGIRREKTKVKKESEGVAISYSMLGNVREFEKSDMK